MSVAGNVGSWIDRARTFVTVDLWSDRETGARPGLVGLLQFSIMVIEGFVRDKLLLRASGLAYFTVLSVVPLLAVAVSIAGAVGVGTERFVDEVVGTLAAVSPEAQAKIRELVAGASFAGLGTLSAAFLFLTTVFAISQVETAFNGIWGVAKSRSLNRRVSDYLAVIVVGPVLGGVAFSLRGTMESQWALQRLLDVPVFSTLYAVGLSQLPLLVLALVFAFLYWFLPNTRVRPLSALLGGVPAAILTLGAQSLYVSFSIGAARADAFFGTFASLAVLFVWIYAFWAIVLFGAEIAFAHQNLHLYRRQVRGKPAGPAEREAIGLRMVLEVGRRFRDGAAAIEPGPLSDVLHAPVRTVRDVADRLCEAGILSHRAGEETDEGLQLGRPAEAIAVMDVLGALRGGREAREGGPADAPVAEVTAAVEAVFTEIEETVVKGAGGRTVADLLRGIPPEEDAGEGGSGPRDAGAGEGGSGEPDVDPERAPR